MDSRGGCSEFYVRGALVAPSASHGHAMQYRLERPFNCYQMVLRKYGASSGLKWFEADYSNYFLLLEHWVFLIPEAKD